MKANNKLFGKRALHFLGVLLCVIPPIVCTLSYFPLWRATGTEHMISGGVAILLILSSLPFYKYVKKLLESCASYILWLIIFLFCALLSRVIGEITVIAFVGFISNLLGALLMKIAEKSE